MTGVTSRTRAARIVIVVGVATVVIVLRLLVGLSLAVLFAFHPTILEPDFDLPLGQTEHVGHLDPPAGGQVYGQECGQVYGQVCGQEWLVAGYNHINI